MEQLSGSHRLNLQEAQLRFALQIANLCERHHMEAIYVSVRRHEFCDCLNVTGRFEEDEEQLHEAFVPIDIPADWSEERRDALEDLFASAARVAAAVVAERRQPSSPERSVA